MKFKEADAYTRNTIETTDDDKVCRERETNESGVHGL
jgi:hypothetical protein